MAKHKHTPWMEFVKKFRADHKGMDNRIILVEAGKAWRNKGQGGGSALGGALSPESISGIHATSGAAHQEDVTQYSGGKSRRVKRRGAKRSTKKRSGSKKRSAKRRH